MKTWLQALNASRNGWGVEETLDKKDKPGEILKKILSH